MPVELQLGQHWQRAWAKPLAGLASEICSNCCDCARAHIHTCSTVAQPGLAESLYCLPELWSSSSCFIAVHWIKTLSIYSHLLLVQQTDQQHLFVWAAPNNQSSCPPQAGIPITRLWPYQPTGAYVTAVLKHLHYPGIYPKQKS